MQPKFDIRINPISANERVQLLDVLRGIAIFGMFTVNMTADIWWGDAFRESQLALPDFVALVVVDLFSNGKFITIFSFLFGIGFFVQTERAGARGDNVAAFYIRRSAGLLFIGVVAMACTLPTWILIDYAIIGLALLLFRNRSPRTILVAAVVCFLLAKIFGSIIPDYLEHTENVTLVAEQTTSEGSHPPVPIETSKDTILRDGDFLQVSSYMLRDAWESFSDWHYYLGELDLLGIMLLGLFVGRQRAIWDPAIRWSLARKVLPWLIGIGFGGCLIWVVMQDFSVGDTTSVVHLIIRELAAWPIGMPLLGLGYAAAITLLIERESWRKRLIPFAAVGRMALTNYLITGFVAAFISFSWGLGLYGGIMPAVGLLLVLIIYAIQVLASRWWMARFHFGPAEWLWRSFTYGRLQPMGRREIS